MTYADTDADVAFVSVYIYIYTIAHDVQVFML